MPVIFVLFWAYFLTFQGINPVFSYKRYLCSVNQNDMTYFAEIKSCKYHPSTLAKTNSDSMIDNTQVMH